MKRLVIIITFISFLFVSRKQLKRQPGTNSEIPVAVQEKTWSEIGFSKNKSKQDLVESTYL